MTTTYVRLKNRRGNRENLPQPLAEGEIGLAVDTRELYIGTGSQDDRNRFVQVNSFLNAETQVRSLINNQLVMFKFAETQSFAGDGANVSSTVLNGGTALTVSNYKQTLSGSQFDEEDITVTKFNLNKIPTVVDTLNYNSTGLGGSSGSYTTSFNFVPSAIPEQNSVIVVNMYTTTDIKNAYLTGFATDYESGNTSAVTVITDNTSGEITFTGVSGTVHRLYVDESTGTGFVDIGSSGNFATTKATLTGLDEIDSADDNANLQIRGNIVDSNGGPLLYPSASLSVSGDLTIETDSPKQAVLLSKFLNQALGAFETSVASNIKIFTQDSKPSLTNDQLILDSGLIKRELTANTAGTVRSFDITSENTVIIDYSLKSGTAHAVGTIKIISDGTNVEIMDDRLETNNTSPVVFSTTSVNSGVFTLEYDNGFNPQVTTVDTTMSYTLKRWLTS